MTDLQQLPTQLTVDDADSPRDIVDALILAAFVSGDQPFAHTSRLTRVRKEAQLLPESGTILRAATDDGQRSHLALGDGWTLRAVRWRGGTADITVTAVTEELAKRVVEEASAGACEEIEEPAEAIEIGFWHRSRHGAQRTRRSITAPVWAEIRHNYSRAVMDAMDQLMAVTPETATGRLLLMHGPPGTGKTTALRSLARAWSSWCQVDVVMDPESLFSESSYLMEVAVGDEESEERRFRLLLFEDCDELITSAAKQSSGQAMSRLLNLTDGMLAQGRDVLIGLTTNEPLARLHPAVIRPGRCLAQIEVGKLPHEQAVAWLDGHPARVDAGGATLAELYALRRGDVPMVTTAAEPPVGYYL
ncbi:hypothetical protein F4553_007215 [Allocatelliglobosispora scoriae]|uniref:AAA+ ATPase domain-containing protein n=1 Tax=Allocatelliglobosispora scoriae TaxID=643052 RepID=A0A841C4N0_9ACTN|nr:DUF5925 domain-containing protein [Allocatelliglobosispora scoriae]MBB5873781.1 hypothetical protein [Allocatelliglobosispora scoriae]